MINYQLYALPIGNVYTELSGDDKAKFISSILTVINNEHYKELFEREEYKPVHEVLGDTPVMLSSNVALQAVLKAIIEDYEPDETKYGGCFLKGENGEPAGMLIYIEAFTSPEELLGTVRHELVHIDQFNRGDLKFTDTNYIWKGKTYSFYETNKGVENAKYPILYSIYNLPWEEEAYMKTATLKEILGSDTETDEYKDNIDKVMSLFEKYGRTDVKN